MHTVAVWLENQMGDVLSRAQNAVHQGCEFNAGIPGYCEASLGVILSRHMQLYITYKVEEKTPLRMTVERVYEWRPTPPGQLGSLIAGKLLHIPGQDRDPKWPQADAVIEVVQAGYEDRPGLIIAMGSSSLQQVAFIHDRGGELDAWPKFNTEQFLGYAPHGPIKNLVSNVV